MSSNNEKNSQLVSEDAITHEEKNANSNVKERELLEPVTTYVREWSPGLLSRLPYLALGSLVCILGLIGAVITVLLVSRGKDVETWCSGTFHIPHTKKRYQWQFTVSVWLSTISLIANKLMALAFAQAVTIAWWTGAMRGRTLRQLHLDWAAGQSIVAVILNLKLFNWICFASVFFTLFSVHAPILQKASHQIGVRSTNTVPLSADLAQSFPPKWSGSLTQAANVGNTGTVGWLSDDLLAIMRGFNSKSPIQLGLQGCDNLNGNETCSGTFHAIGFDYDCSATTEEFLATGYYPNATAAEIAAQNGTVDPNPKFLFDVSVTWNYVEDWSINLSMAHKTDPSCVSFLHVRNCTLTPALIQYPISVTNGTASLLSATSSIAWNTNSTSNETDTKISIDPTYQTLLAPVSDGGQNSTGTTVGGLAAVMQALWESSLYIYPENPEMTWIFMSTGSFGSYYLNPFDVSDSAADGCKMTTNDPFQTIASNLRDIMFRTAVYLGQSSTSTSKDVATIQNGTMNKYHTIYKTNVSYLAIGAVIMLLGVFALIPLFRDFWKLGRSVSLSPLEMSKALDGGAQTTKLAGQGVGVLSATKAAEGQLFGTNAETNELVDLLGDIQVRYGEVAPQKLGLGLLENVHKPHKGQVYH